MMEAGVGGQRRARGGGRQAREREREKGECGGRERMESVAREGRES